MDDKGDTGYAPRFSLTLQILRCVVLAALLTGAVWVLATYALDWADLR